MKKERQRATRASSAPSAVACVVCAACLGGCGEAAPKVPVAAATAPGRFTAPAASVERHEEQPERLELEGASVNVPAWFEPLSAERLEALRLDMGGRDPARRVTIVVMRAPQGHATTVVQISHTALSAKSGAGAPVRGFLEAQIDAMKKTMIHPDERVLQFGTTTAPTSIDFGHIAEIKKPSGQLIQIQTRGAVYVTAEGRAVRSQVECVAEPVVAEQLCVQVVGSWQLTIPPSLPLDAVIGPA